MGVQAQAPQIQTMRECLQSSITAVDIGHLPDLCSVALQQEPLSTSAFLCFLVYVPQTQKGTWAALGCMLDLGHLA